MRVFLDTNIILDLLLEREGWENCARLLQWKEKGVLDICVSVLTMANVAYIYRKVVGEQVVIPNLKYLSAFFEVLSMDDKQFQTAILKEGKDFEDILQAVCAAEGNCAYIVTRNIGDFVIKDAFGQKGTVLPPALTPSMLLKELDAA